MTSDPLLIVLSGPSGVGKDSVISRMVQTRKNYHVAITATSRPPRQKERDGIDYIFLSTNTFREMIERNEFLEWAIVHGNYYGVPNTQVLKPLGDGKDVIVKPDVQGAASIKKLNPNAILIFLSPPSLEELSKRLHSRMTESSNEIQNRLQTAEKEMIESNKFDHIIINQHDRLNYTVNQIESILDKERHT